MLDYLKDLWARLVIHWHVVLTAFIAVLPSLLDYLGVIDLKPFLVGFGVSDPLADLIVKCLPFVLAFVKPMLVVEPKSEDE